MVARRPERPSFRLAETKFHPPLPRKNFIQRIKQFIPIKGEILWCKINIPVRSYAAMHG